MEYKEAIAKFIDEHGFDSLDNQIIALNTMLDYVGNNHYAQKLTQLLLFINSNINIRDAFVNNGLKGGKAIFKEFYSHHKKDFLAEDMVQTLNPISAIYCADEYVETSTKIKKTIAVIVRATPSGNHKVAMVKTNANKVINQPIDISTIYLEGEIENLDFKQGKEDLPYFVDDASGKRLTINKAPHIINKSLTIRVHRPKAHLTLYLPKKKLKLLSIKMDLFRVTIADKSLKQNFTNKLIVNVTGKYGIVTINRNISHVSVKTNLYAWFTGAFRSIKCHAELINLFLFANNYKSIKLDLHATHGITGMFGDGDCRPKLKKLLFHNKQINGTALVNKTIIYANLSTYAGKLKIT